MAKTQIIIEKQIEFMMASVFLISKISLSLLIVDFRQQIDSSLQRLVF
jgi:hypothetical protein